MDSNSQIWSLIIDNVYIEKVYTNGFNMCRCNVCNDYQARGGWKQEGDKIIYNCFNCSTAGVLDTNFKGIPQRFLNILESFYDSNIINEIKTILLMGESSGNANNYKGNKPSNTIELPKEVSKINDVTYNYLKNKRGIDPNKIECYNYTVNNNLYVLFPVRERSGRLVCWNARLLKGTGVRYLTSGEKNQTLYNIKALHDKDLHRIYITDGIFDCLSLYPYLVSTLGSSVNNDMIQQLKNINKQIVLVVDNDLQGGKLGKLFLDNGFNIAKIPSLYKDLNALYCSYGFNRIKTLQYLNDAILDSVNAKYHIKNLLSLHKE